MPLYLHGVGISADALYALQSAFPGRWLQIPSKELLLSMGTRAAKEYPSGSAPEEEYELLEQALLDIGNWRGFDGFYWGRRDEEDALFWTIQYTSNRDSGLIDQSNHDVIDAALLPFRSGKGALDPESPDVEAESHSHWAVGHINGFSIRVLNAKGEITSAYKKWHWLRQEMRNYPILDEDDYSTRQYEVTLSNIEQEGISSEREWCAEGPPEGWAGLVYDWLRDNDEGAVEDTDDQGGYPNNEQITRAADALKLLVPEDPDEEGCLPANPGQGTLFGVEEDKATRREILARIKAAVKVRDGLLRMLQAPKAKTLVTESWQYARRVREIRGKAERAQKLIDELEAAMRERGLI